jgi:uncharacterized membrane protein YtjA (UPF0391 family)
MFRMAMIFIVAAIFSAALGFSRLGGADTADFRLFFYGAAAAALACLFTGSVIRRGMKNSDKLARGAQDGAKYKGGRRRRRRDRKSTY